LNVKPKVSARGMPKTSLTADQVQSNKQEAKREKKQVASQKKQQPEISVTEKLLEAKRARERSKPQN